MSDHGHPSSTDETTASLLSWKQLQGNVRPTEGQKRLQTLFECAFSLGDNPKQCPCISADLRFSPGREFREYLEVWSGEDTGRNKDCNNRGDSFLWTLKNLRHGIFLLPKKSFNIAFSNDEFLLLNSFLRHIIKNTQET